MFRQNRKIGKKPKISVKNSSKRIKQNEIQENNSCDEIFLLLNYYMETAQYKNLSDESSRSLKAVYESDKFVNFSFYERQQQFIK